jgi:hypothetical protein
MQMALSAILKAGQWYSPIKKSKKSTTLPNTIRSYKFPNAPPIIKENAI